MPTAKKKATKPAGEARDIRAGLPQVPALYGLKARANYLPFSHAEGRLARARNYWICTTRADGRPHSIPVWGFWIDGAFYFGTARSSRKARNLVQNPAVSVHLDSGDDVVILEGTVVEVSHNEHALLKKLDAASRAKYKMPLTTIPGETVLYRVQPSVVLAWTEKQFPKNATRWQLSSAASK
jgi:pyridoxine/pyridoxamine 5'-phosphate oxidase